MTLTFICNTDAVSEGKCVTHFVRNALHPYPLRVEGEIQDDVGPVREARASA